MDLKDIDRAQIQKNRSRLGKLLLEFEGRVLEWDPFGKSTKPLAIQPLHLSLCEKRSGF